jgi:hypothetical protein
VIPYEGKEVEEVEEVVEKVEVKKCRKQKVIIGYCCFSDFTNCNHHVSIEGIDGWVMYTADEIVRKFLSNREIFHLNPNDITDSRPSEDHFSFYIPKNLESVRENHVSVIENHHKKCTNKKSNLNKNWVFHFKETNSENEFSAFKKSRE